MTIFRDLRFGRLLVVGFVVALAFAAVAPAPVLAENYYDFVNGSGMTEGDPGDGNGFAGGGSTPVDDGVGDLNKTPAVRFLIRFTHDPVQFDCCFPILVGGVFYQVMIPTFFLDIDATIGGEQ